MVADKEINALELDVLDNYLPTEEDSVNIQRRQIFSDDEDKPKLKTLLTELQLTNITSKQQEEIIRLLADIAYGDDYMAKSEKALLEQVVTALNVDASVVKRIIDESKAASTERIKSERLSVPQRAIGKIENLVYGLVKGNGKGKVIDLLLGSLGYDTAIEKITDTALVDLDRVTKIVDGINDSLATTKDSLSHLKISKENASKEVVEVANAIERVRDDFDLLLERSIRENQEVLEKKRRNIRYFTIAFMGRTKAGKSTLHKIITQQDDDDIGVGKLRTTRFNRSWYWRKLRILDTPGIGAPGGASDTEIAKAIIDEADIICYIVTNDSIQETEFDFLEEIKDRNKPLYIVLNVKSNLTQSIRLKRFLKEPNAWKNDTGEQSIQGHLDRIYDQLAGKYNMDAVEIIPIHLLAAQLGFSEETAKKDATILREGSNIFTFTRSVQATVHKTGGLKKSLSVVDGTAYQIHQIGLALDHDLSQLKESRDLLVNTFSRFQVFMEEEKVKLFGDVKLIFSSFKAELENRASAFANENYDKKNANELWNSDPTVKSIFIRLDSRLQQRLEDYNDKVKSQIEEIADDLQVITSFKVVSTVSGHKIVNTQSLVNALGNALGWLLYAIPYIGGWVKLGISIALSFLSNLFSSKEKKIRKATEKMRSQLVAEIDKGMKKSQQDFLENVDTAVGNTTSYISELFSAYIDGVKKVITEIDRLYEQTTQDESAINSLVSLRILEHVGKAKAKGVDKLDNQALVAKYPVKRDWIKQSITYKYKAHLTSKDIDRVTQATQMNILIN